MIKSTPSTHLHPYNLGSYIYTIKNKFNPSLTIKIFLFLEAINKCEKGMPKYIAHWADFVKSLVLTSKAFKASQHQQMAGVVRKFAKQLKHFLKDNEKLKHKAHKASVIENSSTELMAEI